MVTCQPSSAKFSILLVSDSSQTSGNSDDTSSSESDSESSDSESSDSDGEVDGKEKSSSPNIKEKTEYIIMQVNLFGNCISFFLIVSYS